MAIPELKTDRLLLRPFSLQDAAIVQELASVREVAATIDGFPHPYPDSAAAAWIARHAPEAEAGVSFTWALTRRHDSVLVGAVSLRITAAHQRGEIGYWAGYPYWNQGFTTEAAERVITHAFQSIALRRIQAFCLPANAGSIRVLEKLGFRCEGILRDYVLRWEQFQDRAVYGLLKDDWDG